MSNHGLLLHDIMLAYSLLCSTQSQQECARDGNQQPKPAQRNDLHSLPRPYCGPRPAHGADDGALRAASVLLRALSNLGTPNPPQACTVVSRAQPAALVTLTAYSTANAFHLPSRNERRVNRACVRATNLAGRLKRVNTVQRVLTCTTYLRRMFVTEAMAVIMGIGDEWAKHQAGQPATGAWTERRLAVTVYDGEGRAWQCEYAPRSNLTLTGQLSGQWGAMCAVNGAKLGFVARFEGLEERGEALGVNVTFLCESEVGALGPGTAFSDFLPRG